MLLNSTALAALALAAPTPVMGDDVAVSAGTIHLVDQGRVLTGGGTILVRDGRIVTVGNDVALPPGITRVDYGPDAVIVPGFVAADSSLADGAPAPRTVAPELDAIDGFDFYASLTSAVASGVTSAYVTPARDRLIAGRGAVISLGSGDPTERVLGAGLTIHGAISAEARSTPGYWEPPIPATSDVGLGVPENQLPRTTMGAILALDQLLAGVDAGEELDAFGPTAVASLKSLMDGGAAWRITAVEEHEIRALVEFADEHDLRLIVDGAHYAGDLGQELAGVGAHVIYESPFAPSGGGGDQGQLVTLGNGMTVLIGGGSGGDDVGDAEMPDLDVPARLAASGVPIAITPARGSSLRDLRFAASLASRGGLDPATALAAITIEPARMYGVADQIGSIAPGKRADFVVMNGSPLEPGASVRATWIGGEKAWSPNSGDHAMTVVSVDELHLGDGRVHEPGEVLMHGSRIVEVGRRVSRPSGAVVVRGAAAMPGIVDAGGRLGLEGSRRTPSTDFDLTQIVEPGDETDRAVAMSGVTTVLLDPRGSSNSGAPILAYHPAAVDFETLVIDAPAAVRVSWTSSNRFEAGKNVRKLLDDAVEYHQDWLEYEQKLSEWEPEPVRPEFALPPSEDDDEDEDEDDEDDEEEDKKKKKKKSKDPDPDPVTGIWLAHLELAGEDAEPVRTRLQVRLDGDHVAGFLRSAALSSNLIEVHGSWDAEEGELSLSGEGDAGDFTIEGELSDITIDAEEVRLEGTLTYGELEAEIDIPRTSREYPIAKLPERPRKTTEEEDTDDGKPKAPRSNPKLEPWRRAIQGQSAVVVEVERWDEILECVDAFEAAGIEPILLGADDISRVANEVEGRVAGVLLDATIVTESNTEGSGYRLTNRYAALQGAGIPVAFRSEQEGGAAQLPLRAAYAVANGMSPVGAIKALTYDAARMFRIEDRVGILAAGRDADLLLLDGSPLDVTTSVKRVWVAGTEIR